KCSICRIGQTSRSRPVRGAQGTSARSMTSSPPAAQGKSSLACGSSFSRRVVLLGALAVAASFPQENYQAAPKYRRAPPIREVLERVNAAKDEWTGEQDFEDLQKKVKEVVAGQQEIISRFRELRLVEAKIVESARSSPAETQARLKVRVEFGGIGADGRL